MKSVKYNMYREARKISNIAFYDHEYVRKYKTSSLRFCRYILTNTDLRQIELFFLKRISENSKIENIARMRVT